MHSKLWAAALTPILALPAFALAANINGGMPNRISMNVTVPKQTQGATFGEKVQAGVHSAAGAVSGGVGLVVECGVNACVVALPDGSGYRAALDSLTLAPLDVAQGRAVRRGGATPALIGAALPGGAIVSAAVSSVGNLAGSGGGAAAASYAATGRSAAPLASSVRSEGVIDVTEPLADGDYALAVVVEKATSGLRDTLKTQVRMAAPVRVRMRLVFTVADGTLRARHDSSENSIAAAP